MHVRSRNKAQWCLFSRLVYPGYPAGKHDSNFFLHCLLRVDAVPAAVHDPAGGGDGLNLEHIVDTPECQEPEGAGRDEVTSLYRRGGDVHKRKGVKQKSPLKCNERKNEI